MAPPRDPGGMAAGRTTTRVRYPETDRMGVAHHTHFLVWFELGRTELMRELGCTYASLEDHEGISFPVVRVEAEFQAPARYDEEITIATRISSARGARVRFEYTVSRLEDGKELATGYTEHAAVNRRGRPTRIPDSVRDKLEGC